MLELGQVSADRAWVGVDVVANVSVQQATAAAKTTTTVSNAENKRMVDIFLVTAETVDWPWSSFMFN